MQGHVLVHPSLQGARHKPKRVKLSRVTVSVILEPAGLSCPILTAGEWRRFSLSYLRGLLVLKDLHEAVVRPEHGLVLFTDSGSTERMQESRA